MTIVFKNFCSVVEDNLKFVPSAQFANFGDGVEVWDISLQVLPGHLWLPLLIPLLPDIICKSGLAWSISIIQGSFMFGISFFEVFC